jgi:RimJ/RimL family protein N-acetyltransferase
MAKSRALMMFESERLWLRPTTQEDAEFILQVFNSPGALRFIGDRNLHSREDSLNFLEARTLKQLEERGHGTYTVVEKSQGEKVGVCGVYYRPGLERPDLGYALLPAHEGKGYAREASLCLMEVCPTAFGITELAAITHPENARSGSLLKKLGFQYVDERTIEGMGGSSHYYEIDL